MDYHIIKISRNKKQYLDLLLLGDEQETMIDRYLERGDLFVLEDNGIKAVGVVTKEGPEICELKNIAVTPSAQRQGYGRKLINFLINHYSKEYTQMMVGTGDVPGTLAFYKSTNIRVIHTQNSHICTSAHTPLRDFAKSTVVHAQKTNRTGGDTTTCLNKGTG